MRISDWSSDVCSSDLALCFEFWKLPGHKHLVHDGKRLVLVARWPGCCLRFVLAPGLADGMAYAYAIRACAAPCERYAALASELNKIAVAAGRSDAHTSELQSLMRISYAVFCLERKTQSHN